jgi:sulfate adenylyltransferase
VTTPEQLAAPVVQLSDLEVGDLQLALDGVTLPWSTLGGHLAGPRLSGLGAAEVALAVDASVGAAALEADGLVLTDREQTPIALLAGLSDLSALSGRSDPSDVPEVGAGRVTLAGRLRSLRARESRLFLDRVAPPAALGAPHGRRRVVVVGRPLLSADVESIRAGDEELVLLVPVEGATPDGVPAVTLMRSVVHVMPRLGPRAKVVATALHWRDPASDQALSDALGAAYGAGSTVLVRGGSDWSALLGALNAGAAAPDLADLADLAEESVLAELRRWRPPPAERGAMILFTGLSGSGKSTLARDLTAHIVERTPRSVSLLDGDDVRRLLSSGLGFDHAARDLNVRRIGYVGSEIARHGGLAVCAPIAPYAESRAAVRAMVEPVGDFVLVHVSTPLAECERRDLKGLYARARAGLITEFTGISDPYDEPTDADLVVDTSQMSRGEALDRVLDLMHQRGWIIEDTELDARATGFDQGDMA